MKIELSLKFGGDKTADKRPPLPAHDTAPPRRRSPELAKWGMIAGIVVLVAAASAVTYRQLSKRHIAPSSPFTARVQSSVQFPLYYPTRLPAGYSLSARTVTEPKQGVVVFQLKDPAGSTIYISEEARPSDFDLGGFYKQFSDLKEVGTDDGAIAVGRLNSGQREVASRTNTKTWVLATTSAPVPLDGLLDMLQSLALSY